MTLTYYIVTLSRYRKSLYLDFFNSLLFALVFIFLIILKVFIYNTGKYFLVKYIFYF